MEKEMFDFYKNALSGAITAPLCADYKNQWRSCNDNKEALVKLVMRQQSIPYFITHCYNGKGLSKEYILQAFKDYINNGKNAIIHDADGVQGYTYSLYVAFEVIFKAAVDVLSFMWCSNTHVVIQASKCPILYVGANSTIHITCEGYNRPKIYLFDNSKVILYDIDSDSEVVIYKYSDSAQVEIGKYCIGKVKTFNKELRL